MTSSPATPTLRLCFVCLGNICRSPTAEGIMLRLVAEAGLAQRILVESAGTAAYHVGERPDPRTLRAARRHGVELPSVARAFARADFARFDYVLAMDRDNHANLLRMAPSAEAGARVRLLRSFEPDASDTCVPDPYYGGPEGFERVFQICDAACRGLLAHLLQEPPGERPSVPHGRL
jgi:protein-tyrosine phosphatase